MQYGLHYEPTHRIIFPFKIIWKKVTFQVFRAKAFRLKLKTGKSRVQRKSNHT